MFSPLSLAGLLWAFADRNFGQVDLYKSVTSLVTPAMLYTSPRAACTYLWAVCLGRYYSAAFIERCLEAVVH